MNRFRTVIAIAVGTLFAGAALAQSNYEIEQRDRMQQERIERGIRAGQLTHREADRLLAERAHIERLERRARADGVLTRGERARIDHAQDRLGRDIYRESHDRQVAHRHGRPSDRPHGWDRRNGNDHRFGSDHRHGNHHMGRPAHANHREGLRHERNEWHGNGVTPRTQSQRPWTQPAQVASAARPVAVARHGGDHGRRTR